jgi:hypothetical protein
MSRRIEPIDGNMGRIASSLFPALHHRESAEGNLCRTAHVTSTVAMHVDLCTEPETNHRYPAETWGSPTCNIPPASPLQLGFLGIHFRMHTNNIMHPSGCPMRSSMEALEAPGLLTYRIADDVYVPHAMHALFGPPADSGTATARHCLASTCLLPANMAGQIHVALHKCDIYLKE